MNFESQMFRNQTAKDLKSVEKSKRPAMLRDLRTESRDYSQASFLHSLEVNRKLMTERIRIIAEQATMIEGLKQRLDSSELLLANDVMGIDHGEHLAKRVEMAEMTGCVLIVPEDGGLAKKTEDLMSASGREVVSTIDEEKYFQYLQDRFPNLLLTPDELHTIRRKLPPEIFASIDGPLERSVVLLNSLEDTQTKFSCAGHKDKSSPIDQSEKFLRSAYLTFFTKQPDLTQAFKEEFAGSETISVEDDEMTAGNTSLGTDVALRFSQAPSEEWIKEHKKRTAGEIEIQCRRALAKDFDAEISDDIPDKDYFKKLLELQRRYLQALPQAALHYQPNSKLFREMQMYNPEEQILKEYSEYYQSEDAERKRNEFLERVEQVLIRYRKARNEQSAGIVEEDIPV